MFRLQVDDLRAVNSGRLRLAGAKTELTEDRVSKFSYKRFPASIPDANYHWAVSLDFYPGQRSD